MMPNLSDPDPGENGSAAEMDARAERKRRERIVETARAIFVQNCSGAIADLVRRGVAFSEAAIWCAEPFEGRAAEYLRGGK